jgi:hypothetical protein
VRRVPCPRGRRQIRADVAQGLSKIAGVAKEIKA